MQFKKIVGFGDSFIWGDELLDPLLESHPQAHPVLIENTQYRESNCFLGQMGQHYGVPVENFGIPGGSLQSTIWTYLWWMENRPEEVENSLIIVGLTGSGRTSFYNPNHVQYSNDPPWNKYVHSAWVTPDMDYSSEWIDTIKQLTVLSTCRELEKLNYQQAVWFFEGQAKLHPNRVFQLCTISPPCVVNVPSLIWSDRCLTYVLKKLPNSKKLFAEQGHPNEIGHKLTSEILIKHVDSCIIKEC
jgi:hypothetical protein